MTGPPGDGVAAALVRTHEWFAHNSGWAPPDDGTMSEWLADGVCRAPDDCLVAPDAACPHGLASWWLVLEDLAVTDRRAREGPDPAERPSRIRAVSTASDASADPPHLGASASVAPPGQPGAHHGGHDDVDNEIPVVPTLETALPDLHVAHVGAHDVTPPHELNPVERFDRWVDEAFDTLRGTEPSDRLFYAVTELADFSLLWLLVATAKAAISDDEIPNAVRVAAVLAAESVVVNAGIKSVFKRERPVVQVPRPYKLRVPLTTSFPSGHSSAAMVAAMLLSQRSRRPALWWSLAVLVASSRVYVRIHHASDVVGGLALGVVLGQGARVLWPLDRGPLGLRWAVRRYRRP